MPAAARNSAYLLSGLALQHLEPSFHIEGELYPREHHWQGWSRQHYLRQPQGVLYHRLGRSRQYHLRRLEDVVHRRLEQSRQQNL